MSAFACPRNPEHQRFFAQFQESVDAFIDPNGDRGEDISNTYEGEGQRGPTWCYDCRRDGVDTVAEEVDTRDESPMPDPGADVASGILRGAR